MQTRCKCRQHWNEDKYKFKCKELIDKGVCNKGFTWNPSNCECECDKSCDIGEYLDYSNCKCRKRLVDKLVEECTETIDEVKIDNENKHENKCSSCTVYIVLFFIPFIPFAISVGIGIYFVYYKYMNRNEKNVPRDDYINQTDL